MSETSAIEWTDATWNPVRGCTKVSPGCANCYAETFAERFRGVPGHPYEQGFDLRLVPDKLAEPLRWKKPRRVFVNSMSDLFQDGVPDVYIERVFSVMALAERHTFQLLTKRPERMLAWFMARRFDVKGYAILQTENEGECFYAHPWPLPNVWIGVSVENQHFADERIPLLLQTPAAVRFISAEPLLSPVTLAQFHDGTVTWDWIRGDSRLDWVIVGGESGPDARSFDVEWARSIVRQCKVAGVPAFIKQLGSYVSWNGIQGGYGDGPSNVWPRETGSLADPRTGQWRKHLVDRKGGDMTEWPADLRVREFPRVTR